MGDMMTFPDTVEEFMEQYKIVDTEHVYTNGVEMVPIFRMEQWFEHQKSSQNVPNYDLISRKAAIEVIDAVFPVDPMKSEYAQGVACGAALAKTYVKQLPSAQPERKKGEWIQKEDPYGFFDTIPVCSECGHTTKMRETYNYCPNCGAKMEGNDATD